MPERIHLPLETRGDLENIIRKLDEGFERNDEISYQPWGTEKVRVAHLIRYSDEEKAERELEKERRSTRPRPNVDINAVTVPIISAKDDKLGKENLYKEYAALGYHEVHRTSQIAVMKLDDPRGVMLSDEELMPIIDGLYSLCRQPDTGYDQDKLDKLIYRLTEIWDHSQEAKKVEEEDEVEK